MALEKDAEPLRVSAQPLCVRQILKILSSQFMINEKEITL